MVTADIAPHGPATTTGRLSGKTVIVNGGRTATPKNYVRALLDHGARVAFFAPSLDDQSSLDDMTHDLLVLTANPTKIGDWAHVLSACTEELGTPSVLINDAGSVLSTELDQLPKREFLDIVDSSQISVLLGMQSLSAVMRATGGGSIINVCSTAGMGAPLPRQFARAATDFAIRGMTRAAALELASHDVRVNALCIDDTPRPSEPYIHSPATNARRRASPADQPGDPVSAAVVFLASDDSSYMTGSDLVVNRGSAAR